MKRFISILIALLLCLGLTTQTSLARAPQITVDGEEGGGGGTVIPGIRLLSSISTINDAYGTGNVWDMLLKGNTIYTAGTYGDPVFNVSDPYYPRKIYEMPHANSVVHNAIKVSDNKYYALGGSSCDIWDLASFNYLGGTFEAAGWDVDVVGNKLYSVHAVTEGPVSGRSSSLEIYDVTDPTNIFRLGREFIGDFADLSHPAYAHNVIVENGYAYVGMEGARIYDISDSVNPTLVSSLTARNFVQAVDVRDDMVKVNSTIFKAHKALGILVLDARILGVWDSPDLILKGLIGAPTITPGGIIALEVVGNRALVATAADKKFKILDISDVNNPQVLDQEDITDAGFASVPGLGSALEIEVDAARGLAFVAGDTNLLIYDISDFLQ